MAQQESSTAQAGFLQRHNQPFLYVANLIGTAP